MDRATPHRVVGGPRVASADLRTMCRLTGSPVSARSFGPTGCLPVPDPLVAADEFGNSLPRHRLDTGDQLATLDAASDDVSLGGPSARYNNSVRDASVAQCFFDASSGLLCD